MNWQEIVKQYDLDVSIVNFNELKGRIDAEFYKSEYLENEKFLSSRKNIPLGTITSKIIVGYVSSMVSEYNKEGITLLQTRNVSEFFVNDNEITKINEDFHNKLKKSQVKRGDILVARSGSFGNASIYLEDGVVNSSDIIIIEADQSKINPFYLTAFLNSNKGKLQLYRFASGGLQGHVNTTILHKLRIVSPTKKLEKHIEKLVSDAYAQKIKSKDLYSQAEQLILAELGLADYVPSEANTSIRNLFECQQENRFDAEYWMPKYDEIIDRVISYKNGFSTIGKEFKQLENNFKREIDKDYNYIEIGDVNVSTGEVEYTTVIGKELPANAKIKFGKKQLIVSKVRPNRGAITILDRHEGFIGSGAFTVLNENGNINLESLMVYLKTQPIRDLLLKFNTGTSYPVIIDSDVLQLPIPLVEKSIQDKIAGLVNTASKAREQSKQLLEKAKCVVEIFIEQDETKALEYLES